MYEQILMLLAINNNLPIYKKDVDKFIKELEIEFNYDISIYGYGSIPNYMEYDEEKYYLRIPLDLNSIIFNIDSEYISVKEYYRLLICPFLHNYYQYYNTRSCNNCNHDICTNNKLCSHYFNKRLFKSLFK